MRKTVHDGFNFASPSHSLVERSKPKPTTFLPQSQKQHFIVNPKRIERNIMNENLRKLLTGACRSLFSFSTESTLAPKATDSRASVQCQRALF
jgi:hypothetical protein